MGWRETAFFRNSQAQTERDDTEATRVTARRARVVAVATKKDFRDGWFVRLQFILIAVSRATMTKPLLGRVTILDVAEKAGVSPSTVSLVLNGKNERIREETSQRVLKAVEELGYAANQMARGLKTGFVPTIGLVVPTVANPFWGEFARCVEHAAMALDYQVLLCNSERNLDRERLYLESMLARGIRGVILGSSPLSLAHISGVARRGLQVVTFDRLIQRGEGLELDSVRVDNVLGAKLAVEHLQKLGHRKIAFVSGLLSSTSRTDRLEGYRSTLSAAGTEPKDEWIWAKDSKSKDGDEEATEIGRAAALAMLQGVNRPTAFFAINDMTAVGIYSGVRELGLRIPEDISVVGFDDIHLCQIMSPTITTVRQPLDTMMNKAVDLLIGRMEGKIAEPPTHLSLEPKLIQRGSTARCRVAN